MAGASCLLKEWPRLLNQGGILRDKGMANASGFKIDTAYNNVNGKVDKLDADKTNNLSQIGAKSWLRYIC